MNANSNFKLKKNGYLLKFIRTFKDVPFYPKNVDYYGNPRDLCSLIRGLLLAIFFGVLTTVKYLLTAIVIIAVTVIVTYIVTLPFQYFMSLMFFSPEYALHIEPPAFIIGAIEVFFLTIFLIDVNFKRFVRYLSNRKYKSSPVIEKKQSNVIVQYIKDKHNKICRSIELIDE